MSCDEKHVGENVIEIKLSSKFFVQVLEKLPANCYRNVTVDSQMFEYRLQREDY